MATSSPISSIPVTSSSPQIDRAAIVELVDKFLTARKPVESAPIPAPVPPAEPKSAQPPPAKNPGPKATDFVCEDDVVRAIAKGEKIYVNTKTIITPSARDLGQSKEVFAKGN